MGSTLPSSDSAESSLTINYNISGNTGWVQRAQSSDGTWNHSKNTDKFYLYKNLAIYKITSIDFSFSCGAAVQDGGSASCNGNLYIDKLNSDTSTSIQIWQQYINSEGTKSGSYTYTITNEDFSKYNMLRIRASVGYSASAGWNTYSQVSTSYSFGAVAHYQKC